LGECECGSIHMYAKMMPRVEQMLMHMLMSDSANTVKHS